MEWSKSIEGHFNLVNLLIKHNADVNVKSATGSTALHSACAWDQKLITELLISSGANVDAIDNNGQTPLFFAVMYGLTEIVQILLRHKAVMSIQNKKGETVQDVARKKRRKGILNLLGSVKLK